MVAHLDRGPSGLARRVGGSTGGTLLYVDHWERIDGGKPSPDCNPRGGFTSPLLRESPQRPEEGKHI